ncbi:DUF4817 domain-containing protein [Trichonephila clavipes]|nr:DUF4817 domain-containing protein [Trichonephila clavipes]
MPSIKALNRKRGNKLAQLTKLSSKPLDNLTEFERTVLGTLLEIIETFENIKQSCFEIDNDDGFKDVEPLLNKRDEGHNVTVNGDRYRAMITNFFIPELNNHDIQELWFQREGATCHTARATIDLLKDTFGDRLISRFVPANWPPRSCDLTPLDYFLWDYVKSLVYADKPQTLDHFKTTFDVLLPIYGHKCWKKSSKIERPDWTTSESAVALRGLTFFR